MKPQSDLDHETIADWVRGGGTLVYTGDGSDPYHAIRAWWNEDNFDYIEPAEHLFKILNVPIKSGTYRVGEGKVLIFRESPARLSLTEKRTDEWVKTIIRETNKEYVNRNHFIMKRGPYKIVACMEECLSSDPVTVRGNFIDMLSDDFAPVSEKTIHPGEVAIVYDLEFAKKDQEIIATTARIESMESNEDECEIVLKAALNIDVMMRLKMNAKGKNVYAKDETGEIKDIETSFDEQSGTLFIKFESTNQKTSVVIRD